LLSEKVIAIL